MTFLNQLGVRLNKPRTDLLLQQGEQLKELLETLHEAMHETRLANEAQTVNMAHMHARLAKLEEIAQQSPQPVPIQLAPMTPHLRRNLLPNDDAAVHKLLTHAWRQQSGKAIGQKELLESGFRVFSQNDEDGILLRIFSQIGTTNHFAIEIGSNCSGSDLEFPENLSTNLIVHHGWHGVIMEIDALECERTRHFFASNFATKHFHAGDAGRGGYFSPLVIQGEITPDNIDRMLTDAPCNAEPDLFVIDIDGGDYAVVDRMSAVRPRVMVLEFEKRFRDRHAVVQFDRNDFGKRWAQSGAASLPAWEKLMRQRGYQLCAVGTCGFNAFYVRADVADGRFEPISASQAFDSHPILSNADEKVWLEPDETWRPV